MSGGLVRRRLSARFHVVESPAEAFDLFTPLGESAWADGWAPVFPAGGTGAPGNGLVFETAAHGGTTTWIVVDVEPAQRIRYARSWPGMTAGTVEVAIASGASGSWVTVTYDLTALSVVGQHWLQEFAAGYEAEIAGWATAIAAR
jgi:hypothetical protein